MHDRLHYRESFDALHTPLCRHIFAGHTTHLLRVRLEKCRIEFTAKAIEKEILKCFFRTGEKNGIQIREPDFYDLAKAEFEKGIERKLDRIVEKRATVDDARFAGPYMHYSLSVQWRCFSKPSCQWARHPLIGDVYASFFVGYWEHFSPPAHNAIGFGEKSMSTDINSVSLVIDRAGDTSYIYGVLFDDSGFNIGAGNEFVRGSKSRGSRPDNDRSLRHRED